MPELTLNGCTPEPLMNYLKALGVLRLVSEDNEHGDPEARGCWRNDVFALHSKLFTGDSSKDREVLVNFFVNDYKPTPIVAPWNGGSGFYKKWNPTTHRFKDRDVVEALEAIAASTSDRFEPYRKQLISTKTALAKFGKQIDLNAKLAEIEDQAKRERWSANKRKEAIKKCFDSLLLFEIDGGTISLGKADKDEFLVQLRGHVLDDQSLAWLDAAIVLLTGQKKNRTEAPALGSGGNIGNSDFSARFMQLLPTVVPLNDTSTANPRSPAWLSASLWSEAAPGLLDYSVDQFDPGKAGNANMGQGLSAEPFVNPWDYVLMIEGALLLGGTVVKRLGADREKAAFPFSADSSSVGFASAGIDDTRGELWLPLWRRPCSVRELKALLGEGRAELGRRSARTAVDFARAAVSLGTDRGFTGFVRYEFQKRLGDNYLANSLGKFACRMVSNVDLLRQFDRWLNTFRDALDDKSPQRFQAALRAIEKSVFQFCQYAGPAFFQAIVVAMGRAENELALSAGKIGKRTVSPITNLSAEWIVAANDNTPEFEIALALAGIYDSDRKIGSLRSNLEPVMVWRGDNGRLAAKWADENRAVVWKSAGLTANLAAVLRRRLMDGERHGCTNLPLAAGNFASLDAVSRFLAGELDDQRIGDLLWGLMLFPQMPGMLKRPAEDSDAPSLPRSYALLKLLFLAQQLTLNSLSVNIKAEPSIVSLLTADHVAEACRIAMRRLRASGLSPLPHPHSGGSVRDADWQELEHLGNDGQRLAAAMLLPLSYTSIARLRALVVREAVTEPQTTS
ncbi:MAG: type I-U CRISPR-associated protein Csx17 [Acidobacteriota bacterium]